MKNFDLLNEKRMIICAHQGARGGNIPGNNITSFEIALTQGADMIELDVTKSADNELFVFHPTMEKRLLGKDIDIRTMPTSEIKKLYFLNTDGGRTSETIPLLDDVFEHFKGRCYINVDKFADNPCEIMEKIIKHGISEQIVVKSDPIDKVLCKLEQTAPDICYLTIINDGYDPFRIHSSLMNRQLNYVGMEIVFKDDSSALLTEDFIDQLHTDGKLLWGNSILCDSRYPLAGIHSDDTALRGRPDLGWGWFAHKGFDIIQTDWVREVKLYLDTLK